MAFKLIGTTSGVEADTDLDKSLRISNRPIAFGALGHYQLGVSTGILPAALGANSEIFQFRWAHASNLAVIRKVRISASVTTTMFAAGVPVEIDLIKSSAWTVAGTGGAAPTLTTNMKKRGNMASMSAAAGDIRVATTAALGAGTKTLEGASLVSVVAAGPITASLNGSIIAPGTLFFENELGDGDHPLVLATNEGFSIRSVAVPATGTWRASFIVTWAETTAF